MHWAWCVRPGCILTEFSDHQTPLIIAAVNGDIETTHLLLDHGANIHFVDKWFYTPLHLAAKYGFSALVDLLLGAGANLNAVNRDFRSPCMLAALGDSLPSLQILVNRGADLQLQDVDGSTTLSFAADASSLHTFTFLLGHVTEFDLGHEGTFARSAFARALQRSPSLMLNLAPNSTVYIPHKGNVVSFAVITLRARHFQMLLRRLPKELIPTLLRHRHVTLGTPLYSASTLYADINSIKHLLDEGADVELEGGRDGTPLMGACANGRLEAVKILVDNGARTSYSKDGETISALRVAKNHPDIVRWLLVGRFMEGPRLITGGTWGVDTRDL